MWDFPTILAYLAFAGAIASWIAGAVFCARAGAGWIAFDRLAVRHRRASARAGGEAAAQVNKALVAFIACMLVGVAAFSASANLHRFAK